MGVQDAGSATALFFTAPGERRDLADHTLSLKPISGQFQKGELEGLIISACSQRICE